MSRLYGVVVSCAVLFAIPSGVHGQTPCPRNSPGSMLIPPSDRFSSNGVLQVAFTYQTRTDPNGNILYCFTDETGAQSPTLHLYPGDHLIVTVTDDLPPAAGPMVMEGMPAASSPQPASGTCGSIMQTLSSVNLHFHGTNTPPVCHQDEVIKTIINPGETFQYNVAFPIDEPPGLYWYHPHIHGISEEAAQGGATGAIVIEGIQNVSPITAGLPQRVIIVRDNQVPGNPTGNVPGFDISVNYTPVPYPNYPPVVVPMQPGATEFWRVVNASADTIINLQLQYDGVPQPLTVVALDGVPVNSQDGKGQGSPFVASELLIPPAGRGEFLVKGPAASVQTAQLVTLKVDTGPKGDNDPLRPLLSIQTDPAVTPPALMTPAVNGRPVPPMFAGLAATTPTAQRRLYFSEAPKNPNNPDGPTNFYITVDGQKPELFNANNPPSIVTTQGSVEDWTIENRAGENHEFHIHQTHFLLLERSGVAGKDGQYRDMVNIPYWPGTGPYPNVKVRIDFRGPLVGDFVYHCHILNHEDHGMMAIVRVNPAPAK